MVYIYAPLVERIHSVHTQMTLLTLEADVIGGIHDNRGKSHEMPKGLDTKKQEQRIIKMNQEMS